MEVELKEKDYRQIEEFAHSQYVNSRVEPKQHDLYVCQCYVKAVITFMSANSLVIEDGKLVKKEVKNARK